MIGPSGDRIIGLSEKQNLTADERGFTRIKISLILI